MLYLTTNAEFVSRDVKFTEHVFPFHASSASKYIQPIPANVTLPSPTSAHDDVFINDVDDTSDFSTVTPMSTPNSTPMSSPSPPPVRRTTREVKKPVWMDDYVVNSASSNLV